MKKKNKIKNKNLNKKLLIYYNNLKKYKKEKIKNQENNQKINIMK